MGEYKIEGTDRSINQPEGRLSPKEAAKRLAQRAADKKKVKNDG